MRKSTVNIAENKIEVPPPAPEVINEAPANLDALLKDYTEPAQIPEVVSNPTPGILNTAPPSQTTTDNWRGNPAYYQTGKKAGQPKPNKGLPPKVAFRPDYNTTEIGGDLISGVLFLTMIDLLFPMLVAFANNKFSKKKVKPEDLQMTEKQKKMLEPVADKVAAQLKLQAPPTVVLFISMAGIYGMNLAALKFAAK
jgi:hypothetical protein